VPLSQPDPLTLDVSSTVLPTCFGGCNGALHLSADGGTVPYLISWKNGQSGNVANNICAGSYNVVVTDSNNCNYAATFVLPDPEKEEISGIQDNIRLCDGQDLTLDPGDWASCEWLENGAVISNGSKYDIKKAGTYTLNVISSKGCTDTKTFTVEYIKDLLKARFLLSGDAVAGEGVEIIDISWPVPDSINWIYNTDSVALLSSSTDRQNIIFQYPGVYLVRLVARTAQCVDEDAQYITIYATKDEYDKGKRPVGLEDDITELFLYPNPNKGTFTIEITLKDQQKISLDIYRAVEGKPVYNKALEGSVYYKEEINLSGQVPGVYSLVLTTAKQRKFFLFVIM
jgi:hypothetical protein